eukprot:gene3794-7538_t
MRDNWNLALSGVRIELLPYRSKFVSKYHEWMTDPFVLEMTASEPLTLKEEYKMQKEWMLDPKKCTFIIAYKDNNIPEIDRIIGDVNIFFNDYDNPKNVEVDIMIANECNRRKGYGKEAVLLMMQYAMERLHIEQFYCKINASNTASISLFQRLGFLQTNYVEVFQEYELCLHAKGNSQVAELILRTIPNIIYSHYSDAEDVEDKDGEGGKEEEVNKDIVSS